MGCTFLALFAGFRSLLVAIKAVLLNLLSVGAAFGALVLVFQEGYGVSLFGLSGPTGSVFPIIPVLVFCIVFGLSMDYEVILVARVAEARRGGLDESGAIAEGVARTATVITSAAAIMIVVFAGFRAGRVPPDPDARASRSRSPSRSTRSSCAWSSGRRSCVWRGVGIGGPGGIGRRAAMSLRR